MSGRGKESSVRSLGPIAATLLTAGMIIGTGIFGALGATVAHAGSALILAMIPGALVAWSTGVSGAQLGVNFPKQGGAFIWARAFHHNSLAFVAGCCYIGQGIVGVGVVACICSLHCTVDSWFTHSFCCGWDCCGWDNP